MNIKPYEQALAELNEAARHAALSIMVAARFDDRRGSIEEFGAVMRIISETSWRAAYGCYLDYRPDFTSADLVTFINAEAARVNDQREHALAIAAEFASHSNLPSRG